MSINEREKQNTVEKKDFVLIAEKFMFPHSFVNEKTLTYFLGSRWKFSDFQIDFSVLVSSCWSEHIVIVKFFPSRWRLLEISQLRRESPTDNCKLFLVFVAKIGTEMV